MAHFADGTSEIENSASLCSVPVVGLYDQGKDQGLTRLANSREGACIALCLRWLGCIMLNQDFWGTTFAGKNKLKNPGVLDRVMGWLEGCDSQTRAKRLKTLASNLGLATYMGPTQSGMKWASGSLKPDGEGLAAEVFDGDSHCLIGLMTGATITTSSGDGHALAFARQPDGKRRFFDPNFGEFIVDDWDMMVFLPLLWQQGGYKAYRSFSIARYHPTRL